MDRREGGSGRVSRCQAQLLEQCGQMSWMKPSRAPRTSSPWTQPFGEVSISTCYAAGCRKPQCGAEACAHGCIRLHECVGRWDVLSRKHPSSLHSPPFGFPSHQEHAAAHSAGDRRLKAALPHSYSATTCCLMPWNLRCLQSPKRCLEQSSSQIVVRA